MPPWLSKSITGTSIAVIAMAALQWGACRFYVLPSITQALINSVETGKEVNIQSTGCADSDSRTVTVAVGVLTTLISLSRSSQ